ncbi:MAG: O-antigen ligase family protein [Patescibacteria group bacterium]|jgi:O-antigen ligase|nr:O-antigen ligase family protein [bacterium]HQC50046.1 O-antigen ligase family protein [bacterium]
MTLVLVLAILFFTAIAVLRLDIAVFFIIALLPSYLLRFTILQIPMTFLEIMILISFLIWFVRTTRGKVVTWFKDRKKRQPYPFALEIIIILLSAFIAVIVTNFKNPDLSLAALGIFKAYFFEPMLLFILILNVLQGKSGRKKIVWALATSCVIVILPALFQQLTGWFIFNEFWANPEQRRVVSWFGYPNAVGLFLAPIIMVLIGYLVGQIAKINSFRKNEKQEKNVSVKKDKKIQSGALVKKISEKKLAIFKILILVLIIFASWAAIYFAKSEGALAALALAIFIFFLLVNRKTQIITLLFGIIALSTIILTPNLKTFVLDKIWLKDLSGEIRKQQWRETLKTLKGTNFITGNGLAGYQTAVLPYHQEGIFFNRDKLENFDSLLHNSAHLREKYWQPVEIYLYPHNIFLNFWSELGILGALIFDWLIVKYLIISLGLFLFNKKIKQNSVNRYLALGLFSAMIVILVHGLVDVPFFKNDLAALFFILLALLGSLMVESRRLKSRKL